MAIETKRTEEEVSVVFNMMLLGLKDEINYDLKTVNTKKPYHVIRDILVDLKNHKMIFGIAASFYVCVILGLTFNLIFPKSWTIPNEWMEASFLNAMFLFGELFILIYFLIKAFHFKYQMSRWQYFIILYLTLTYCYVRLDIYGFGLWHFHEIVGGIAYLDIPLFLLFFAMIVSLWREVSFIKEKPTVNSFLVDDPLANESDFKGFESQISTIRSVLFEEKYDQSFSIGIMGPWGTGKSSFIKAIEHEVLNNKGFRQKNIFYVPFSPFLNHSEDNVINEFFVQLENQLKERSGKLSTKIHVYAEKLSNVAIDQNIFSILKPAENYNQKDSVAELYADISKTIRKLKIKLIVSIDDLDRLNGKEIVQVLKLIRNTSNFPNTIFLTALDKEYVLKALREENHGIKDAYLDKFFQLELAISQTPFFRLKTYLIDELKIKLDRADVKMEEQLEIESAFQKNSNSLQFVLKSYRDAIRMVNQFVMDYQLINTDVNAPEIDHVDLLNMTSLRLKFPLIHGLLHSNKRLVLDFSTGKISGISKQKKLLNSEVVSYSKESKEIELSEDLASFGFEVESDLKFKINSNYYPHQLGLILIRTFGIDDAEKARQSISYISQTSIKRDKIRRIYFERAVGTNELTRLEFNSIYNTKYDALASKIKDLSQNQDQLQEYATMSLVQNHITYEDRRRKLENLIIISIELDEFPKTEMDVVIEILNEDLKTANHKVFDIFQRILDHDLFALDRRLYLLSQSGSLIKDTRVKEIVELKIKELIDAYFQLIIQFGFHPFWSKIHEAYQHFTIFEGMKELVNKAFIKGIQESKPDDFIEHALISTKEDDRWTLDPIVIELFDSIDGLIKFLSENYIDSAERVEELKDFLELKALLHDLPTITYKFKALKPRHLNGDVIKQKASGFGHLIFKMNRGLIKKMKENEEYLNFSGLYKASAYSKNRFDYLYIPLGDNITSAHTMMTGLQKLIGEVNSTYKSVDTIRIEKGVVIVIGPNDKEVASIRSLQPFIDWEARDIKIEYLLGK